MPELLSYLAIAVVGYGVGLLLQPTVRKYFEPGITPSAKRQLSAVTTGLLFLLAAQPNPEPQFGPANFGLAALASVTIPLAFIDVRVQRLPNPLTLGLSAFALLMDLILLAQNPGEGFGSTLLLATLVPAGFTLLLSLVSRGAVGMGDVKLSLALGLVLAPWGLGTVIAGFSLGYLFAGLVGVLLLITKRGDLKTYLPFGPFLLLGAWFGLLTMDLLLTQLAGS